MAPATAITATRIFSICALSAPGEIGDGERRDDLAGAVGDRRRESLDARRIFALVVRPALPPDLGELGGEAVRVADGAVGVAGKLAAEPRGELRLRQVGEEHLARRAGVKRQALAGHDGQRIFARALHRGDDEDAVVVEHRDLAALAGQLGERPQMRHRQAGEVVVLRVADGARGERQEPRPEPQAPVLGAAHHVVVLQRVQDAIDGGARQPQRLHHLADGRAVRPPLEQRQHVHHAVDHRDAVALDGARWPTSRSCFDRTSIDFRTTAYLTSRSELEKFTIELSRQRAAEECRRGGNDGSGARAPKGSPGPRRA